MCKNVAGLTSIRTEDNMRRVPVGTKILDRTELGIEYATIIEYQPSEYSKDVYLVQWADGSRTLFEMKKENIIKKSKKNARTQKK